MDLMGIDPIREVANIITNLKTPGEVTDMGNQWFGAAAVISISWFGIRLALSGGEVQQVFGNFLRSMFFLGVAWWLMPANGDLVGMIQGYGQKLATAFSGTSDLANLVADGITKIINHIGSLGEVLSKLISGGETIDGITGITMAIARLMAYPVPILFMALAMVMMLLMVIAYFLIFVLSLALVAISKMLAPVFIPFLVLRVTNFLFDGWLRFLIVGVLYQVVGAIILQICNQVMTATIGHFATIAASTQGLSGGEIAEISIVSIIVAGVTIGLAYLMLQVGSLAQGLVSGTASFSPGVIGREGKRSFASLSQPIGKGANSSSTNRQSGR